MVADIHKVIGKIPFKPKKGFVLPKYRYTGPYTPLHLQLVSQDKLLPWEEPYNAVDAIPMRHDICYRDNDNDDCKMLAVLIALSFIGLKHRLGMGIQQHYWSSQLADELHKPRWKRFQKRNVFAKQVDDIWTADLVDMSPFSRSNSGYR